MYIRRKLYSNIDGERVPVEQTVLFSAKEDAKGAAKGASIAAGTVGLGAAIANSDKAADFLKGRRIKAIEKAKKETGEAARNLMGKSGDEAKEAQSKFEKVQAKGVKVEAANKEAGKIENSLRNLGSKAKNWLNAEDVKGKELLDKNGKKLTGAAKNSKIAKEMAKAARNRKIGVGLAAAGTLATGAGVGAGIAHLKGKKKEEEKVYSVLMTEEELRIFAEVAKGASIGAGIATGATLTAGGAALATKGAGKLERKLAKGRVLKAVAEKNNIMKEAGEKAKSEAKKWAGKKGVQKDMVKNAIDSGKAKASNVKISEAGKIEKGMAALAKGGATATKWVKANPKLAAGIAAGTIATGAGIGAGIGAIKDKKK